MTLRELQEKREKLLSEARERLDQINKNTDESRTAELEAQHDAAMEALDEIDKQIERELQHQDAEKRNAQLEERINDADPRRPIPVGEGREIDDEETVDYRAAFHALLRNGGDISALSAEEAHLLRSGHVDVSVEERQQLTTSNAAGGYTVPVELQNILIEAMAAHGPMYDPGITTEINTSGGNKLLIPTIDDTGVTAEAHTEGDDLTDDGGKDATFGQKELDAFVYDTEFIKWSMELAQDSIFNVESLLGRLVGERLGRIANKKLTVGTNSGEPNGVVTASSLGVTAASATAIAADELIDLVHSVDPAYRKAQSVRFMMNDQTLKLIRKLKDGDGNYLWQMGNVQQGTPSALLGYSIAVNQDCPDVATGEKSVTFGDFSKYYVRKVGAPAIGVMRERFWPNLGIAGLIRFDGELGDTKAIKHLIQA